MRIVLGYSYYPGVVDVREQTNAWLSRLRQAGFDVHGFCLTLEPPRAALKWLELDGLWKRRDRVLMNLYEALARRLGDADVFVNWNGINVHPEFLPQLDTVNVFGCFDDPESSEQFSRPVAAAYDLCMVGNIAELEAYRSWGARHVRHWPLGFRLEDHDPSLTRERILTGDRPVDIALLCERTTEWRRARLEKYVAAYPQGVYRGNGWPAGFLAEGDRVPLLQRTKIGLNVHNSTGPINYRTFYLPANGVLQLCDNKSHLGQLYQLGEEVVGYDTIDEALELTRYYLAHDEARRAIAVRGWERALRDYNEVTTFALLPRFVEELGRKERAPRRDVIRVMRDVRSGGLLVDRIQGMLAEVSRRARQMFGMRSRIASAFRRRISG